ncbi:hypothetical protein [Lacinutrix undariae]
MASFFLSPEDVNVEEAEFFVDCENQSVYCNGYADGKAKPGDTVYDWNITHNNCMADNGCIGAKPESPRTTIGTGI